MKLRSEYVCPLVLLAQQLVPKSSLDLANQLGDNTSVDRTQ